MDNRLVITFRIRRARALPDKAPKRATSIEIAGPAFGLFPLPSFTAFAVRFKFSLALHFGFTLVCSSVSLHLIQPIDRLFNCELSSLRTPLSIHSVVAASRLIVS